MIKRAIILILIFAGLYWLTTSLRKDPTTEPVDTKPVVEEAEKAPEGEEDAKIDGEAVTPEETEKVEATEKAPEVDVKTETPVVPVVTETAPIVETTVVAEEKVEKVVTIVAPKPAPRAVYPNRTTDVKIYLYEWNIDVSTKEIPSGTVNFEVINSGRFSHDFTLKGIKDFGKVAPRHTANFTAKLLPGDFELFSGRRDDYENGMKEIISIVK